MERPGWSAFAAAMTLVAVALAINGFLLMQAITDGYEAQSGDFPPEAEWYDRFSQYLLYAGAALAALGMAPMAYGWAKVRSKTVVMKARPATPEAVGDEDAPLMPPGFFGPAAKTRRVGAAPLASFTLLGLAFVAGAATLLYFGAATLEQTSQMAGRGLKTAVLWGQLMKFVALPLVVFAALSLGIAWGRWFPLGEVEVIEAKQTVQRAATGYSFNRQD